MLYLLSLLPGRSMEEDLNPPPLVAEISSKSDPNSLYVNVLGGSKSRGGIALDPLAASGRLAIGKKIKFAQLRNRVKPSVYMLQHHKGVHICLQTTDPRSSYVNATNRDPQEVPIFVDILESQGLRYGVFCAESAEGLLPGNRDTEPWLCRIPGSTTRLQVTPKTKIFPRFPVAKIPNDQSQADMVFSTARGAEMNGARLWTSKKGTRLSNKKWAKFAFDKETVKSVQLPPVLSPVLPEETVEAEPAVTSSRPPRERRIRPTPIGKARYDALPPDVQTLLEAYPATAKLLLNPSRTGKDFYNVRSFAYDSQWYYNKGDRRSSFRARADWFPWRSGTLKRSDLWQYGPGGYRLQKSRQALYRSANKEQSYNVNQLSHKYAELLTSQNKYERNVSHTQRESNKGSKD
jgi:hypothetical protein